MRNQWLKLIALIGVIVFSQFLLGSDEENGIMANSQYKLIIKEIRLQNFKNSPWDYEKNGSRLSCSLLLDDDTYDFDENGGTILLDALSELGIVKVMARDPKLNIETFENDINFDKNRLTHRIKIKYLFDKKVIKVIVG